MFNMFANYFNNIFEIKSDQFNISKTKFEKGIEILDKTKNQV
jgi:hypothetical protein